MNLRWFSSALSTLWRCWTWKRSPWKKGLMRPCAICCWLCAKRCGALTRLGIGSLDLFGHGSVDTLLVVVQSLSPYDCITNGFEQAISAWVVMYASGPAAAIALNVSALGTPIGVPMSV